MLKQTMTATAALMLAFGLGAAPAMAGDDGMHRNDAAMDAPAGMTGDTAAGADERTLLDGESTAEGGIWADENEGFAEDEGLIDDNEGLAEGDGLIEEEDGFAEGDGLIGDDEAEAEYGDSGLLDDGTEVEIEE